MGELLSLSDAPASNARIARTGKKQLDTTSTPLLKAHVYSLNLSGNRENTSSGLEPASGKAFPGDLFQSGCTERPRKRPRRDPGTLFSNFFGVITQQSRGLPEQAKARLGSRSTLGFTHGIAAPNT